MEKIRIKNYRSIEDSGEIELAPLTVLVGRNSSGKSSFIRLFPLLKQTTEKNISEPVLWYGDYVDLGDYENAVCKQNSKESIDLTLTLKAILNIIYHRLGSQFASLVEVSISIKKEYIEYLKIKFDDQVVEIHYEKNTDISKIIINGDATIVDAKRYGWRRTISGILPEIYVKGNDKAEAYLYQNDEIQFKIERQIWGKSKKNNYGGIPRRVIFRRLEVGSKSYILDHLREISSEENKDKFNKMKITHKRFVHLNNQIIAVMLCEMIEAINYAIVEEMRNTNYVKPIRAMVDRFYRVQGISINELDADGSNLPMILYNMSDKDLTSFERWSKEKFGVVFSVSDSKGHVSLVIKNEIDSDENTTNLADTGYGYSQMLPIVVLLWMLHNRYDGLHRGGIEPTKTIVIEQPELHLHPAYQAKMIDVFVNIVKEAKNLGINLKIVFETHSEAMITRLGRLINVKQLDEEWVKVLIFDKVNGKTRISEKEFSEKGLLKGWPIDFFAAEEVD